MKFSAKVCGNGICFSDWNVINKMNANFCEFVNFDCALSVVVARCVAYFRQNKTQA